MRHFVPRLQKRVYADRKNEQVLSHIFRDNVLWYLKCVLLTMNIRCIYHKLVLSCLHYLLR